MGKEEVRGKSADLCDHCDIQLSAWGQEEVVWNWPSDRNMFLALWVWLGAA